MSFLIEYPSVSARKERAMSTPPPIQHVVLATDGSSHADSALAVASGLIWSPNTTIWVTSIVDVPVPPETLADQFVAKGVADWRQVAEMAHADARDRATTLVATAADQLRAAHPDVTVKEVVRTGEPAAALIAQIDEVGADLVIAGTRGHTVLRSLLLGSVSEALVTTATCPVLIVRDAPETMDTVLVAVGSREDADSLADLCLRLPLPAQTQIVAVTASAPLPQATPERQPFKPDRLDALLRVWAEEDRSGSEAIGQRFVVRFGEAQPDRRIEARVIHGVVSPSLLEARGDVAPAILEEEAAVDAFLTVVGARASGGIRGRLGLGSVSRKIVRRSRGAVLVAR